MQKHYKILSPTDLKALKSDKMNFQFDVLNGLSEQPKRLSSKYFYDDTGSQLFSQIMDLPEYYLTRCEFEIIATQKQHIADTLAGEPFNLIELGAGDGRKTQILVAHFLERGLQFTYTPIDISEGAMRTLTERFHALFPDLPIRGIVAEYFDGINWLATQNTRRNFILFLGSNLGNFPISQAKVFLRNLWSTLQNDDCMLIGFDLKKDIDLMLDAYNDSSGITAAFNLNLLNRINRELGGDFNLDNFRAFATYNVFSGAIESYLVSLKEQTVFIKSIGQHFHFKEWEPIHTEYSYKFLISEIENLAESTGYQILTHLFDSNKYFVDSLWKVHKPH